MTRAERAGVLAAAIVTVGTELTAGLATDTNGPEIALALESAGTTVSEIVSVPDDLEVVAGVLERLIDAYRLVIVTGGLGPTHDDITRQAAARALGRPLARDERLVCALSDVLKSHKVSGAESQVLGQADIIEGARIIWPRVGTAPGQVIAHPSGTLVLLPGPPREMRPMLTEVLDGVGTRPAARIIRTVGLPESDVQLRAGAIVGPADGVGFTVLARPGLVDVVLRDTGAGPAALDLIERETALALGDACYATGEESLAAAVLALALDRGMHIVTAESCTGGLVASSLTDVPGSSEVFRGGVVAYSDQIKVTALGVDPALLAAHGAVSASTAAAMAQGARLHLGADIAVATTGIAGPGGGSASKPVGTVWFAIAAETGTSTAHQVFRGDREMVRSRATVAALDMLRRTLTSLLPDDRRR